MSASALRPAVPLLALIIAGCIVAAIGNGVRTSFGLFTLPMTTDLGLTREGWGMAMAIQNLAWGIAQPFADAWADKVGTGRTIAAGAAIYAIGLVASTVLGRWAWRALDRGVAWRAGGGRR